MEKNKKLHKIKSSVFARSLSLAKMTIGTGAQLASHGLTTILSDETTKNDKWNSFLKGQAKNLSQELGELKGSIMKAGQMLSMYGEYFLPAEANQLLKSLQSQSPALEWAAIESVIKQSLPTEKLALLEIDPSPIGSASLGQVHKARIKSTGQWIALKIQYPGVDKAIDSDLKAIRSFLSLAKLLPRNLQTDHIFNEVREMLHQEINYRFEKAETINYRQRLQGDERFVVPAVFEEFCSEKIIATSFEPGLSADDPLIQSLSQERRNRLAANFLDLYLKELFQWGIVQTDPHLGNYRIRLSADGQDKLVLLDFGAVRAYDQNFLVPYYKMIRASIQQDRQKLEEAAVELKFVHDDDSPELKKLFMAFCDAMVEPFTKNADYDWQSSDLPQRLTKKVFQMVQQFQMRPPPREVLFLDRKTGGVFIFLAVLKAKLNGRPLLDKYL